MRKPGLGEQGAPLQEQSGTYTCGLELQTRAAGLCHPQRLPFGSDDMAPFFVCLSEPLIPWSLIDADVFLPIHFLKIQIKNIGVIQMKFWTTTVIKKLILIARTRRNRKANTMKRTLPLF